MGTFATQVDDHWIMPADVSQVLGQQHEFRVLGRPVPQPVPVQLIVDSGSKRTSLVPEVIRQLQPVVAGRVRVETSLAVGESQLFWIRFEFPTSSLKPIAQVAVARLALPRTLAGFDGIIGRDVLRQWDWVLFRGGAGVLWCEILCRGFYAGSGRRFNPLA